MKTSLRFKEAELLKRAEQLSTGHNDEGGKMGNRKHLSLVPDKSLSVIYLQMFHMALLQME